MKTGSTGC